MIPVRLSHPVGARSAPQVGATGAVVLVAAVGAATGSRAAAAALACTASELDRAALLIDLSEGRSPRSTLVASAGAGAMEERLVAHMPDAAIASRGRICLLTLPPRPEAVEPLEAALPLARESAAVVHLPPQLLQPLLAGLRSRPTAALLRADLAENRALTALVVRDLMARGLRTVVLKHPLGWLAARVASFGEWPTSAQALPESLCRRLLYSEDRKLLT